MHGYALKIYPFTFSAEKSGVLFLEKQEIYKMFKTAGLSAKRKQAKNCDILCLLRYIFFETETGSCDPVSDYFFVTVLIPVSVRILPSSDELPIEILL